MSLWQHLRCRFGFHRTQIVQTYGLDLKRCYMCGKVTKTEMRRDAASPRRAEQVKITFDPYEGPY